MSGVRVLIVADTHGHLDLRVAAFAADCDVVVHAGDVGADEVLDRLASGGAAVHAVRGNNDVESKWRGDARRIERDLREATERDPELVPAWLNYARVLEQRGRVDAASQARRRAAQQACRAPRGYPHGVGSGEILEWGVGRRPLLLLEDDGLRVALPAFHRDACRALRSVT